MLLYFIGCCRVDSGSMPHWQVRAADKARAVCYTGRSSRIVAVLMELRTSCGLVCCGCNYIMQFKHDVEQAEVAASQAVQLIKHGITCSLLY